MKKFILTENQIKYLKEHIRQLHIPFEEFGDEYGKEPYDYYMDFIEEVSEIGTLPPSNIQIQDILNYIIDNNIIFDVIERNMDDGASLFDYGIESFIQKYPESFDIKMPNDMDEIGNLDEYWILNHFTRKGIYKYFTYEYGDIFFDLLNKLKFKNGLIYIERVISIPFYPKYQKNPFVGITQQQFDQKNRFSSYTEMKNYHGHFGYHWSWLKGGAEDFSYSDDFTKKESALIFKGFVNPNDVDWEETILNSMINYRDEHELTLKENAKIQINEIEWLGGGANLPLHQPIIVKA